MKDKNIPFSLEGRNIIVTGASSGIGRQCAITCSRMGATVALFGRDEARLKETLSMMEDSGRHIFFSADLTEYKKIDDTVKEVVKLIGRIDGVLNCAGISATLPLNATTPEKMEQFFKTNAAGALNLTRNALKQTIFSEQGGSIVFISSVMGAAGEAGKTLYAMTKGALEAAVKSMAVEFAPRKIRVNAVSPGVVESPMSENAVYSKDKESLKRIKGMHPLGLGKPEDVANACLFLLSDESRWITGTSMIIDGGYLAR